jgi:hypothetical protein
MVEQDHERIVVTIEVDLELRYRSASPDGEPIELALARQLDALLRQGSIDPSSLFIYHGSDINLRGFSGSFLIENPGGYHAP